MKHTDLDLSTRRIAARFSILRFRHLLEEHGLRPKILQVINATLATRGLLLKGGTVVDATVVGTAANVNDVTQGRALPGPCKKPPHKSSRFCAVQHLDGRKQAYAEGAGMSASSNRKRAETDPKNTRP
jgi:IS5 family transposase